jgi:hypothetical protein
MMEHKKKNIFFIFVCLGTYYFDANSSIILKKNF